VTQSARERRLGFRKTSAPSMRVRRRSLTRAACFRHSERRAQDPSAERITKQLHFRLPGGFTPFTPSALRKAR
jgi:hypothetical protein